MYEDLLEPLSGGTLRVSLARASTLIRSKCCLEGYATDNLAKTQYGVDGTRAQQ